MLKHYCHPTILKKVPDVLYFFYKQKKLSLNGSSVRNLNIKTFSRSSTILPFFNFVTFQVYNGKSFIKVFINPLKFGHKLGEFSFTKIPARHNKKKKKK